MGVVYSASRNPISRRFMKSGYGREDLYIRASFWICIDEEYLQFRWQPTHAEYEQVTHLTEAPHELKVAAACLCAGLMPPSVFADLLEDHRPDLAEAAAFLREWEQVHKEQQK